MFEIKISKQLDKKFEKIGKKNRYLLSIIDKKISQILNNPYHFKPLKANLKGIRRVHINNHFVLTYDIDEKKKIIKLLDYEHHDKVY